jgi:uncharacterized membrane protein
MKSAHRLWKHDLLFVVCASVAALAAILLDLPGSVVRSALVVPLIVVLPGYALMAAVFPDRRSAVNSDAMGPDSSVTVPTTRTTGVLYSVRIALSVAASVALVAAVALLTNFLGLGFDAVTVGTGVFVVTVLFTAVGFVRRATRPRAERAGVPPLSELRSGPTPDLTSPLSSGPRDSSSSIVVRAVVAVSVLAFFGSVGFAAVETQTADAEFTEVYFLPQNGTASDASDYPHRLTRGEPSRVRLAISNHEGRTQRYTVVTELQRIDRTANGTRITEEAELARFRRTVEAGETVALARNVTPTLEGDSLRLVFLVYEGDAPANPTRETAYRTVQLIVSVGDGGGASRPSLRGVDG